MTIGEGDRPQDHHETRAQSYLGRHARGPRTRVLVRKRQVEKGNEVSDVMDGSVKLGDAEYLQKAAGQFIEQTELGRGPRFVHMGLVRSGVLWNLLRRALKKKLKPKTAEDHAMMCAFRGSVTA
jgi:hypothetical protein